jgi:16S rRNA (adenine1518-N6/adenine1519-N6)-dimethyltransferase
MNNLKEYFQRLCQEAGLSPRKRFGQNFLLDEAVYESIVAAAEISKDETVLEVGPGLGELTKRLSLKAGKVLAVEYDSDLAQILPQIMKKSGLSNIEIINQDILSLDPSRHYDKIVANLPYNISAKFLSQFLSVRQRPERMVLLLQKEVVERICALPGKLSLLGLSVQFFAEVENLLMVPAQSFWPAPQVDSAVIRIVSKKVLPDLGAKSEKDFFRLLRIGFSAKRKMLKNNLASGYHLDEALVKNRMAAVGLKESVRAQELSLEQWIRLLGTF